MGILFKSIGNYKEGSASYFSMVSKKNRGLIVLDDKTLTFESERKDILVQIILADIESFYIVDKFKAPIVQIRNIFGLEFSFCPLKEEKNLFEPLKDLSIELLKALTYAIFNRNNSIIFDSLGFYCENLPSGISWKSGMINGFILLSPEYIAFKPIEEGFFYYLSINHLQSIKLESKGSNPIVYVQTFEDYSYSYTASKLQEGKYLKNQAKTEELFNLLKHSKLEKKSERKEYTLPDKKLIEKVETMLKVSTRIKLEMMREALDIDERLFSEKIFEWAEKFNFVIDGDYLIVKSGNISAFVKNLLLDQEFLKEKKKKKKTDQTINCQLCGKQIDKNSKICPYCGNEIKIF